MSAFNWQTGKPSALNTPKARQNAQRSITQTARVEKMRAEGKDIGTIVGMSKSGDEHIEQWRSHKWVEK